MACASAGEDADECAATAVRNHPEEATVEDCEAIPAERWRAECHFSLAEVLAKKGDRWGTLRACGQAGRYYDECLYHGWTFELQQAADGSTRAVDGIERARPIVEFWSSMQTVGPDAKTLLWNDWWYFAHGRARPARLEDCGLLKVEDQETCREGTRQFVRRLVAETVIRQATPDDMRDRLCRGQEVDTFFAGAWEPNPELEAAAAEGLQLGCSSDAKLRRPWNPVFRPRGSVR